MFRSPVCGNYNDKVDRSKWAVASTLLRVLLFCILSFFVAQSGSTQDRESRRTAENRENRAASRQAAQNTEQEMQDALKRVPWNTLGQEAKAKIKGVVQNLSLFRRMPTQSVYCDPEIYAFLIEHPDVVVGFWERLGATQISLREIRENRFVMKETTGTVANVEVLHRTSDLCIVYARGQYRGPFLARPIDGESVLILRSRVDRDEDNEPYIVCRLDTFMRIDNFGADFLAKLFATSLGKIADSNFEQTVAFVGHVSDAVSINPNSLKRVASGIKGTRTEVREDFIEVVDRVALRSAKRDNRLLPQYYASDRSRTGAAAPADSSECEWEADPEFADFIQKQRTFALEIDIPSPPVAQQFAMPAEETPPSMPIPSGVSTLPGDDVPKSRAVFGTPKIARP